MTISVPLTSQKDGIHKFLQGAIDTDFFYLTISDQTRPSLRSTRIRIRASEVDAFRTLAIRARVRSAGHRTARPELLVPVLAHLARRDPNRSQATHASQPDLDPLRGAHR